MTAHCLERARSLWPAPQSVSRRLLPLQLSMLWGGVAFWVPVEKLYMMQLGFTTATIVVLVAACAAIVPLLEIPSGILADRWSRRGVLLVANVSGLCSVLIAGLSRTVATFVISAIVLGIYLALQSGNVDAMVYDTVVEISGDSADYIRHLSRLRITNTAALIASALGGGVVAALASPRATYLLTAPFVVLSIISLTRFREPIAHRGGGVSTPLHRHVCGVFAIITQRSSVRSIIAALVLQGALLTIVFEFGPLWLISLHAPAALFGPLSAGLVAGVGIGTLLAPRVDFARRIIRSSTMAVTSIAGVTLVASRSTALTSIALVALAVICVVTGTHLTKLLQDGLSTSQRAGVGSSVSTLSWVLFVPVSLAMGRIFQSHGAHAAGGIILIVMVAFVTLLTRIWSGQFNSTITSEQSVDGKTEHARGPFSDVRLDV